MANRYSYYDYQVDEMAEPVEPFTESSPPGKASPQRKRRKMNVDRTEPYPVVSYTSKKWKAYKPKEIKETPYKPPTQKAINDPDALGEIFFSCIEELEALGALASEYQTPSCLDRLLNHPLVLKSGWSINIRPDSYRGSNPDLKAYVAKYLNTYNPRFMDLLNAYIVFFLNNPYAAPGSQTCELVRSGASAHSFKDPERVSCLSHVFQMSSIYGNDSEQMKMLPTIEDVIKIVNKGERCIIPRTSIRRDQPVGSCMEALLNLELLKFGNYGGDFRARSPFTTVIDKYNWSIGGSSGVPAIQLLLDGKYFISNSGSASNESLSDLTKSFLMAVAGNDDTSDAMMDILSQEYDFTNDYNIEVNTAVNAAKTKTTAVDYAIETGAAVSRVVGLLSQKKILSNAPLCKYKGSDTYDTCTEKFITKIAESDGGSKGYWARDIDGIKNYLTNYDLEDFLYAITSGRCVSSESSCMDKAIDSLDRTRAIAGSIEYIITRTPASDLPCTIATGDKRRATNCLDKIIGLNNTDFKIQFLNSGILLNNSSPPECTDIEGSPITCVDKLTQKHEVWLYLRSRLYQLERIKLFASENYGKTTGDEKAEYTALYSAAGHSSAKILSMLDGIKAGSSREWGNFIVDKYDVGKEVMHPPGKEYAFLKPLLEEEIQQLEKYPTAIGFGGAARRNYVRALIQSVSSEKPPKEIKIAPRLFKIYDATKKIDKYLSTGNLLHDIGVIDMYGSPYTPSSLSMYDCKSTATQEAPEDKTISCMQKAIDVAKEMSGKSSTSASTKARLQNVYGMKDMLKPDLCQIGSRKMSCTEYAFNVLGLHGGMDGFTELLSRKDFKSISQTPYIRSDGTTSTIGKEVCSNVSLQSLNSHMMATKPAMSSTSMQSFMGNALELYGQCRCGKDQTGKELTDLQRRECLDQVCLEGVLPGGRPSPGSWGNDAWYWDYIENPEFLMKPYRYHDNDDLFGIAGVYELTYKPSDYKDVAAATQHPDAAPRERFDMDKVMQEDITPAINRSLGKMMKKYRAKVMGEYQGKTNVKIANIRVNKPEESNGDYTVKFVFTGTGDTGEDEAWEELYTVGEAFKAGNVLDRSEIRQHVIKYRGLEEKLRQIATRGRAVEGKESKIKLVISNRPIDFIRSSTCQNYGSCMRIGIQNSSGSGEGGGDMTLATQMYLGGYVAYLASDELSPVWKGRVTIIPAMEKPGVPGENMAFQVNGLYGLKGFEDFTAEAMKLILYDAGYNRPQSMVKERTPIKYIYNNPDPNHYEREDDHEQVQETYYSNSFHALAWSCAIIHPLARPRRRHDLSCAGGGSDHRRLCRHGER